MPDDPTGSPDLVTSQPAGFPGGPPNCRTESNALGANSEGELRGAAGAENRKPPGSGQHRARPRRSIANLLETTDIERVSRSKGPFSRTSNNSAILFALILLSLACSMTQPPVAGDPLRASFQPILRVGTSGDYPPFSDWPPDQVTPVGFSADLARAFAQDRGGQVEFVRFRWPNLLADLQAERFDLAVSGVTVRSDRSIAGRFSVPLTISGAVVLVPKSSPVRQASALDQPGVFLAVNAGGHLERVTRRLFPRATVLPIAENQDVLDELEPLAPDPRPDPNPQFASTRDPAVNGVVTDTLEAPLWLRRRPDLRPLGPLTADRKAALFGAEQSQLVQDFDRWIIEFERSGSLARLRARHGLPATRTADPVAALLAALDERLALMPAIARVKQVLGTAIEDRGREAKVIASAWESVERAAQENGYPLPDRAVVESLFRAQIEVAKAIQRRPLPRAEPTVNGTDSIQDIREPARAQELAREDARNELDQALRPALIRIGDRIASTLR